MPTLRHVICGTDFSANADEALELAIALAAAASAPLTVVHVCEPGADDLDDQRLLCSAGEALSELVARRTRAGVQLAPVLRTGRPWQKLDNVATELGAGLIVIGRSGAGHSQLAQLGSVADQLVRCASRPVLTVPCNFHRLTTEAHENQPVLNKGNTP